MCVRSCKDGRAQTGQRRDTSVWCKGRVHRVPGAPDSRCTCVLPGSQSCECDCSVQQAATQGAVAREIRALGAPEGGRAPG
eukprot:15302003-Alexandrium_andersonii.AAC.1